MARIPSVASLTRRLNEAKTREAALKIRQTTATPNVGGGQPNPRDNVKYTVIFGDGAYIVKASRAAVTFFNGLDDLGLAAPDTSPYAPRGFQPAKVRATRGRANGVEKTADLSKRRYLKYSVDASGETRATYTAPISAISADALGTRFQTLGNSLRTELGEYGRLAFIAEKPVFTFSGTSATTTS